MSLVDRLHNYRWKIDPIYEKNHEVEEQAMTPFDIVFRYLTRQQL